METSVSRETMEALKTFEGLVLKWNKAINLISASQVNEVMQRHILDSLQIIDHIAFGETWLDLGSGGGFPGIVLAIAAKDVSPDTRFTLVESDKRKCAFLRSAAIELGLNVEAVAERIEAFPPRPFDHISARALASLDQLIAWSRPFAHSNTVAVFPKGETHLEELAAAQNKWTFSFDLIQSSTNRSASIIRIRNFV